MTFRLGRLASAESVVDSSGRPTPRFQVRFQRILESIETALNSLQDAIDAIAAAQAAADAANTAAAAANTAAASAQGTADDIASSDELARSYVSGTNILTATDAGSDVTITISAHTRHYPQPDGSTIDVPVSGGSLTGRAYSTTYYIYYDDPSRAGGTVAYQSTTSEATAAQIGERHCVGGVTTPAALGAPKSGGYTRPPGPGQVGEIP